MNDYYLKWRITNPLKKKKRECNCIKLSLNCNKAKLSSSWHNGCTKEELANIRLYNESRARKCMNREIDNP